MRWFFSIIFTAVALVGTGYAVHFLLWQDRALTQFIPVDAVIDSSQLGSHRGNKGGTTYSADIHYHYTFNQQFYSSRQVFPVRYTSSNRRWMQQVVNEHPFGAHVSAFVDPGKPSDSILVRQYVPIPDFITLIVGFLFCVGLGYVCRVYGGDLTTMTAVPMDDAGSQLLLPTKSLRRRYRDALFTLFTLGALCVALPVHYLWVSGDRQVLALIVCGIPPIYTLVSLVRLVRAWSLTRHLSDARLIVKPAPMKRDEPLNIQAECDAFAPLHVKSMRAKIICYEHYRERRGNKTYIGKRPHQTKTLELAAVTNVATGQVLSGQGQVLFDSSVPPSTVQVKVSYPYYSWEIQLKVNLLRMPDYQAVFPLLVD